MRKHGIPLLCASIIRLTIYGTAHSNLTLVCVFLASTREFSKTTRELDSRNSITCDVRESLHCMLNHSSRVLKRVIACENHEILDQIQIWQALLLSAITQLNTHTIHVELTTDNALRVPM